MNILRATLTVNTNQSVEEFTIIRFHFQKSKGDSVADNRCFYANFTGPIMDKWQGPVYMSRPRKLSPMVAINDKVS